MNIIEYYHTTVRAGLQCGDFELFPYRKDLFIGFDAEGFLCVVIKSSNAAGSPLCQRTRLLSVECNRQLSYTLDDRDINELTHIVRCFSNVEKEKEIFLEIIDATIGGPASDEYVMDTFRVLSSFFADRNEPTEGELIGLYAELDAILTFSSSIKMGFYWQSRDRMKFDFSFTDKLKVEVKATTKPFRTHHFKHEQLTTSDYEVIILSYMLRYDDEGVSLHELISNAKPLLSSDPRKILRLDKVLKNVSDERLNNMKFSPEYTSEKRHFYYADKIPKFEEGTPDGVANAEYDCNLDNIPYFEDKEFIQVIGTALAEEDNFE